MEPDDNIKLTVSLSRETDLSLREFLGSQSMSEVDLSEFIEKAIRWRIFDLNLQAVRERTADMEPTRLQAVIDEACASVRKEMWPPPNRKG